MTLTAVEEFDSDSALAVKYDTPYQRAGEHCEVAAIHIGVCIVSEDRQPPAVINAQVGNSRTSFTLYHLTVLVVEGWNAE